MGLLIVLACGSGCSDSVFELAGWGRMEAVQEIVQANPEAVNQRNALGKTPLFFAVTYNKLDMARYLIEQGADANAADNTGYRPLHVAAIMNRIDMAAFLLEAGADIEGKDHFGDTAMHVAAYKNRPDFITLLAEHGGDVNARNNDGRTPLDMAQKEFMLQAADRLTALGGTTGNVLAAQP